MRVKSNLIKLEDGQIIVSSELNHEEGLQNIVDWYGSNHAQHADKLGLRLVVAFGRGHHELADLNHVVRISIPVACGK